MLIELDKVEKIIIKGKLNNKTYNYELTGKEADDWLSEIDYKISGFYFRTHIPFNDYNWQVKIED